MIVNGNPMGNIKPTRGICQRDLLSPYLFLIYAEALSSLLNQIVHSGSITGILTSNNSPRLTHLLFAYDSLLFYKANSVEWRRLMKILKKYEASLGQKLNLNKTTIVFSRNKSQTQQQKILQFPGFKATQRYDTYLGLPTMIGKSKRQSF
jgi:hypothetical protein